MIALFQHDLSPYAQKIRIALREKQIPFRKCGRAEIDPETGILALNPRNELPALVDGDFIAFDSTIILEYLEDKFPAPPMRARSAQSRAQERMIEEICDTHYEAINWAMGELHFFDRAADDGEATALRSAAKREISDIHLWLSSFIGAGGWLSGDRFGFADIAAVPYVSMSALFGFVPEPGSAIASWLDRASQLPSVATTLAEAAAAFPTLSEGVGRLRSGEWRRQYRDHRLEWMIRNGGIGIVQRGLANKDIRFTEISDFLQNSRAGK